MLLYTYTSARCNSELYCSILRVLQHPSPSAYLQDGLGGAESGLPAWVYPSRCRKRPLEKMHVAAGVWGNLGTVLRMYVDGVGSRGCARMGKEKCLPGPAEHASSLVRVRPVETLDAVDET